MSGRERDFITNKESLKEVDFKKGHFGVFMNLVKNLLQRFIGVNPS